MFTLSSEKYQTKKFAFALQTFFVLSGDGRESEVRSIDPNRIPQEGEPDFYETNCHWKGCGKEFCTQDELVRVRLSVCYSFVQRGVIALLAYLGLGGWG